MRTQDYLHIFHRSSCKYKLQSSPIHSSMSEHRYMPTYPLLCLAAQYSERVYERPTGAEKDAHVDANWRHGTKAMVLKSVPVDDMNTIVFAIRGSQNFVDWAVNFRPAPSSPKDFLVSQSNLRLDAVPLHGESSAYHMHGSGRCWQPLPQWLPPSSAADDQTSSRAVTYLASGEPVPVQLLPPHNRALGWWGCCSATVRAHALNQRSKRAKLPHWILQAGTLCHLRRSTCVIAPAPEAQRRTLPQELVLLLHQRG